MKKQPQLRGGGEGDEGEDGEEGDSDAERW